jgi:3-deoxy-D-manno-octulosonate cytidylyltransferase
MQHCAVIIPCRYASTRLPGKPLADILGKPMIRHVYERAEQIGADRVVVATDDKRIAEAVTAFGGDCIMTSPHHASGTERLTEAMRFVDAEIYVNLQGDEPLVRPGDVAFLIGQLNSDPLIRVGTLCHPITECEARDPNAVKVVLAGNGDALYFSRSTIPYTRDAGAPARYLKHVGVYAYRRDVLEHYPSLPQPQIEQAEMLEQLRLLSAGLRIRVWEVEPVGPGVDTLEGLDAVRQLLRAGAS